jgi:hypothetical protein
LATTKTKYKSFNPTESQNHTDLLHALSNITITEDIGASISVIESSPCSLYNNNNNNIITEDIGANMSIIESFSCSLLEDYRGKLFVRDFYNDLLAAIRNNKRSILVGNPGIGKSTFQFYYLARLLNPSKFKETLPPDWNKSTAAPKVVILQIGDDKMIIYDIENRKAQEIKGISSSVLDCFDPKTSLYMMEPGRTKDVEPFYEYLQIPTLITVSPGVSRYKEFNKNGGNFVYMPCCNKKELRAMGAYLLKNKCVPSALETEYSPEKISKRYSQFGGIIRHVLPSSLGSMQTTLTNRKRALISCDVHALIVSGDIEHTNVSHYIMQFHVARTGGKLAFSQEPVLNFVSEDVRNELKNKLFEASLEDKILTLIRNDETGFMPDVCPKLYERVICDLLRIGVEWSCVTRSFTDIVQMQDPVNFKLKLDGIEHGEVPTFEMMRPNILYYPSNPIFEFADILYKTPKGVLAIINVTREKTKKVMHMSALAKLYKRLNMSKEDIRRVKIVLVPLPKIGFKQKVQLQHALLGVKRSQELDNDITPNQFEVWKLPLKYKE